MKTEAEHYPDLWERGDKAAAEAHLEQCESCRFCFSRMEAPPANLTRLSSLPQTFKPEKPVFSARASAVGLLLYAGIALALTAWIAGTDGVTVLKVPVLITAALLVSGLFASACLLARLSVPGEMLPRWALCLVPSVLAMFVIAAFVLFPLDPSQGLQSGGGCLLFGTGFAAGFVPLIVVAANRRCVREWGVVAPVVGAFAGLAGLLALLQHCPIQEATHLTIMHWPAALAAISIGILAGRSADLRGQ